MDASADDKRLPVVVMGVSASGKTAVGTELARRLGLPFVEGDTFHSANNIEKMRRGEPLDDADRAPWLAAIAASLADRSKYPRGLVIACSALKAAYREVLRKAAPNIRFVFLDASRAVVDARLAARQHHFMPASLAASQFATLQRPSPTETDVATLDASQPIEEVAAAAAAATAKLRNLSPAATL
jgi:gluconokinase